MDKQLYDIMHCEKQFIPTLDGAVIRALLQQQRQLWCVFHGVFTVLVGRD